MSPVTDVPTPDASLPASIRHSRGSRLSSSMPNQIPGSLCIGVVNINGMRGKRAELAELVNSTQADILVITETKIDNTMNPSEFLPRHFDCSIHRNRNAHGGGVMLAMKKGIIAEVIELKPSKSGEITCAKIHTGKSEPPVHLCLLQTTQWCLGKPGQLEISTRGTKYDHCKKPRYHRGRRL